MKYLVALCFLSFGLSNLCAQSTTDSTAVSKPLLFSVEEDMLNVPLNVKEGIKTYTSAKKLEQENETVWNVNILNKEQILHSGALCVAEALRLLPNILVRQKGNGQYDVRMRGFATTPANGFLQEINENTMLLLLDNMPLNQAFNNEINWESIPVSLYDIEKIEVLYAPLGTLYGQNPLTGIIHIFSTQEKIDGWKVQAIAQANNAQTQQYNAAIQYGKEEKLNIRLAGNYWSSRRFQDSYYLIPSQRWTVGDSLSSFQISPTTYSHLSNQNYNIHATLHYQPNAQSYIQANLATQNTLSQDVNFEVGNFAQTLKKLQQHYFTLNSKLKNFAFQFSYQFGNQDLAKGFSGFQFMTSQLNANTEYAFQTKRFSITPSFYLNYNTYSSESLSGQAFLSNVGAALRSEVLFSQNWKLSGAIRNDFLNKPSVNVLNFNIATNLKISKENTLRVGYATANKAPTIYQNIFNNQQLININNTFPVTYLRVYEPNPMLALTRVGSAEMSWLWQHKERFELNTQIFYTSISQMVMPSITTQSSNETISFTNNNQNITQTVANIWLKMYFRKVQLSIFATWQKTTTPISALLTPAPNLFGGFSINYNTLFNRLNLNLSGSAFQSHLFQTRQSATIQGTQFVLNTKLTYRFWKEQALFANIRHWKSSPHREFALGEEILPLYLFGLHLTY
jgi:iron complex outermembrane receptor protein